MPRAPPSDVAAYLAAAPPKHRAALRKLRAQILAIAPDATERISYGIIGFFAGKSIAHIASFREHCTLFLGGKTGELAREMGVTGHTVTKGGIHFTPEKPLPADLVRKGIQLRLADVAKGAKTTEGAKAKSAKKAARKATGTSTKGKRRARSTTRAR